MQRVKILGGRLSGRQWQSLAQIVRSFTPSTPLHLTTRQELEIHDLTERDIPAVQQAMARADLTGLGACGDTLRNVTVCQCPGKGEKVQLYELAWKTRRMLEGAGDIFDFPRKFKISFSACPARCGQPWINDLGFVADKREGRWGFEVMAAGSLGARPGTGIRLIEWLEPSDVLPLVAAAVRVFMAHGDRKHRSRARLRHVRERLGDEAFVDLLMAEFKAVKAEKDWPRVELVEEKGQCNEREVLTFADGDISVQAAEALGEIESQSDLHVRINNHHRIVVFGPEQTTLHRATSKYGALSQSRKPQPAVVACPGKRWCSRALVHTNPIAGRIRAELGEIIADQKTVCISGCPNGCVHSAVADIGLIGQIVSDDGRKSERFLLLAGGGMGRDDRLAEPIANRLTADQVIEEIRRLSGPKAV